MIGDIHRFPTSRQLVGYLGLHPTVSQSGNTANQLFTERHILRSDRDAYIEAAQQDDPASPDLVTAP